MLPKFDIRDQDAWTGTLRANPPGLAGYAVLEFAAQWAHLMEEGISGGKRIKDIAWETQREVGEVPLDRYNAAVEILSRIWGHGAELMAWFEGVEHDGVEELG